MATRRAVILLSGGIDSSTTAAIAREDGFQLYAVSFAYGQRHLVELESAVKVAEALEVERHLVLPIGLDKIGGSALTDKIDVPKDRDAAKMSSEIPVTYVPARNTIFLSYALAFAEVVAARVIFIGANAVDYSGYPDCRPEFIEAFEKMANLATKTGVEGDGVEIRAPLIELSKAEIINRGAELGFDYSLTTSCYDPAPDGRACGRCDSCILRRRGFVEAGVDDPTKYVHTPEVS